MLDEEEPLAPELATVPYVVPSVAEAADSPVEDETSLWSMVGVDGADPVTMLSGLEPEEGVVDTVTVDVGSAGVVTPTEGELTGGIDDVTTVESSLAPEIVVGSLTLWDEMSAGVLLEIVSSVTSVDGFAESVLSGDEPWLGSEPDAPAAGLESRSPDAVAPGSVVLGSFEAGEEASSSTSCELASTPARAETLAVGVAAAREVWGSLTAPARMSAPYWVLSEVEDESSADEPSPEVDESPAALDESSPEVEGSPAVLDESSPEVEESPAALDESSPEVEEASPVLGVVAVEDAELDESPAAAGEEPAAVLGVVAGEDEAELAGGSPAGSVPTPVSLTPGVVVVCVADGGELPMLDVRGSGEEGPLGARGGLEPTPASLVAGVGAFCVWKDGAGAVLDELGELAVPDAEIACGVPVESETIGALAIASTSALTTGVEAKTPAGGALPCAADVAGTKE